MPMARVNLYLTHFSYYSWISAEARFQKYFVRRNTELWILNILNDWKE